MSSKWIPSGLGAEPKKVVLLVVLLVLLPVAYWYGNSSDVPAAPASSRPNVPAGPATRATTSPSVVRPAARPPSRARGGTDEFRPTLKLPEDYDLSKVDPTLKTDLLTRVRAVAEAGGGRSLFEFYTPPPPPPKVEPIKPQPPPPPPVVAETKPGPPPTPVKPPPPLIPLKYFGYEGIPRAGAHLRALFVDGEDSFVAGENELIRNRYRVVRIGPTSAELEDTVAKNTQTLRIVDKQDP